MDLQLTLWALAGTAGFAVFAGWRGAQPPDPIRGARLIPWRFLMLLACGLAFLLLVHLAALLGAPVRRP
jgi:type VI protein secretion system component VasF